MTSAVQKTKVPEFPRGKTTPSEKPLRSHTALAVYICRYFVTFLHVTNTTSTVIGWANLFTFLCLHSWVYSLPFELRVRRLS